MCNNVLEPASNPYTISTSTELAPDPTYDSEANLPWWLRARNWISDTLNNIANWYSNVHWSIKLGIGIFLLRLAVAFTVLTEGTGAAAIGVLIQVAIGVGVGIGMYALSSLIAGTFSWSGLANAALDAFLVSSAIAFVTSGISYVKHLCRSKPVSTAELVQETNKQTAVIGKMKDLNSYKLKPGEYRVADLLPDMGSVRANWKQNSSILRRIMKTGNPIRDVSVLNGELVNNTGFLAMERNLLINHGWKFTGEFWILGG